MRFPPVRRPVPLSRMPRKRVRDSIAEWSGGKPVGFYGSGTQALAAALIDARGRNDTDQPEAVIPAYCCPDLVSACVFARVRPVAVDTGDNTWGYDLGRLDAAISPRTVAVLAVNLCGIGDQANVLLDIVRRHRTSLIQDSAQFMPALRMPQWVGDYVVLSFGRGKPLNLFGGGALLFNTTHGEEISELTHPLGLAGQMKDAVQRSWGVALAFNMATHPSVYAFTSSLPGLRVGETRYSQIDGLTPGSARLRSRFAAALRGYLSQSGYMAEKWRPFLEPWRARGLPVLSMEPESVIQAGPLLRLPMLAPSMEVRNRIANSLKEAGLGASTFYAAPINRIAGVPAGVVAGGPYPHATDLADRLFTLPTYSGFDASAVRRVDEIITRHLRC